MSPRDQIPIADAFRALVLQAAPERTDLHTIDSYSWFHQRQSTEDGNPIRRTEDKPAYDALDRLKVRVAEGRIKLRGVLNGKPPSDIDAIDAMTGELEIFEGKLCVYDRAVLLRTYTRVHCGAEDLLRRDQEGPQVRRAKAVLLKLFETMPSRTQMTNAALVKAVQDAIPRGSQQISKDSILRAAGRQTNRRK